MRTLFHAPLALLAAAPLAAPLAAQTPPIAVWNLDDTSGLATSDSGPRGNHGALVNFTNDPAQWVPGASGNALRFDGVDDYVSIQFTSGLPFYTGHGESFSICMLVNGTATDDDRVLSLGSSSSNVPLFSLGTGSTTLNNADKLRVYVRNDANVATARYSNRTVFDNTWHHVAYVESCGRAQLYVDGVLDTASFDDRFNARGTRTSGYGTYTMDRLALGAVLRPAICCHYNGVLDQVQVYAFALSPADVAAVVAGAIPTTHRASIGEIGVGCGPGPLDLYGAGSPLIGGAGFLLSMQGGRPNAAGFLLIGIGQVAPLDLTLLGFVGCSLYAPNPVSVATGALDPFGSSSVLPVPSTTDPALAAASVVFQGAAISGAGLELSNAIVAVLGF